MFVVAVPNMGPLIAAPVLLPKQSKSVNMRCIPLHTTLSS